MVESAYLHVPFCKSICAYCDFFRYGSSETLQEEWLKQVSADLEALDLASLKTFYIGGGTPSALSPSQLERLLAVIASRTPQLEEFTMEINPDCFDEEKLRICMKYGINRLSIGVQSMDDTLLQAMNRRHNVQMVHEVIKLCKAHGLVNLSIDLIYALPDQSLSKWQETLREAVALDVPHISLYALSIEPNSLYGRKQVQKADDELEADEYEWAIAFLTEHGYRQYEVSNFAKAGYESRHNLAYWHYDDFYGIGCGASGKEKHIRYDNERNLMAYLKGMRAKETITLSKEEEMFEFLMMGLRLCDGISLSVFENRFACSFFDVYQEAYAKLSAQGLLVNEGDRIKTTPQGLHLLHEVLLALM